VAKRWRRPQVALLALLAAVGIGYAVDALHSSSSPSSPSSSPSSSRSPAASSSAPVATPTVALSQLPPQVAQTVRLIEADGPFPYSQDGVVFDNNEHLLPVQPRGYYHEYTVPTPGASDRGARRIVTGRDGAFYYTDDHYDSFRRVNLDS
jgi:ribonuclease T1